MITIIATDNITICRALRRAVFIEEQGVSPEDEIDDQDDHAIHLLALNGDQPIGTARLLQKGTIGKIGRVCVLPQYRGQGIGAALVNAAVEKFRAMPSVHQVTLGAQTHALDFYARLGFSPKGPEFMDAGIPHQEMILTL